VLNVWTPGTDDGRRPVMVWFHGGGFSSLSGSSPLYDGTNLCLRGDVVVVTVNHRINLFGFLYLAELGGERYRDSGTAGVATSSPPCAGCGTTSPGSAATRAT
jgi:para-nitrobenzyl esterase